MVLCLSHSVHVELHLPNHNFNVCFQSAVIEDGFEKQGFHNRIPSRDHMKVKGVYEFLFCHVCSY